MDKKDISKLQYLHIEQDRDGIVFMDLQLTGAPAGSNYMERMSEFVEHALEQLEKAEVKGLIYCSPIMAGDFDPAYFLAASRQQIDIADQLKALFVKFMRLRAMHKPIVSILDTTSTNLRLASLLWADYRIALADATIGFPTSATGLFPGFGASSLLLHMLEPKEAIPFLYQGHILSASEALHMGLAQAQAANYEQAFALAKQQLLKSYAANETQKTEQQDDAAIDSLLGAMRRKSNGLIPADKLFFKLVADNPTHDLEEMLLQEQQAWASLWDKPETLNMLRTLYCSVNRARRSADVEVASPVGKLGILGAGIMGSGIAYEAARAGIQVVLKDVDSAAAEHGKLYAKRLTDKLLEQSKIDQQQQDDLLARIYPTSDAADFLDSDMIIEAVFENQALKARVTKESLPYLKPEGIFASNTTALPISRLAEVSPQPQRFIGMHFFSPVDRMPLVEIIRGKMTDERTLQQALRLAHQLGKVPIVVGDGPAFFTSRIFFNYLLEAVTMLLEGLPAELLEQEARQAGFAIGPLAVLDEISLKLMLQVYDSLPRLHAGQERCYRYLESLITQGRNGRKTGAGFYNYDETTGKKSIWNDPNIAQKAVNEQSGTIQKRLLHVMALDSFRCLEEGVLQDVTDADIGSMLGIGFPRHTGGVFSHIDQVGIKNFVNDCRAFAMLGDEWHIPDTLTQLAESDFRFYDGLESNWKGQL